MPPFGRNEWREEDFQLLRNSAIHLFWQRAILDETVSKLREAGYTVIALDAGQWSSPTDLHADIARDTLRCLRPNRSVRSARVDRHLCR